MFRYGTRVVPLQQRAGIGHQPISRFAYAACLAWDQAEISNGNNLTRPICRGV